MAFLDTIADDLQAMLEGEWSETVTIDTGTTTHTGQGVFDLTYQEVNLQTGLKSQNKTPRIGLYGPTWQDELGVSEITDKISANWTYTIRGVNYKSKEVKPDGTGWVMVYFTKARDQ